MKAKDIENEVVRKIVKTALQHKFTVTFIDSEELSGQHFRMKKQNMSGYDAFAALARYMKIPEEELNGKVDPKHPAFMFYKDSFIVAGL